MKGASACGTFEYFGAAEISGPLKPFNSFASWLSDSGKLAFISGELLAGVVVGARKPKALGFGFKDDVDGGWTPTPANVGLGEASVGFAGVEPNENEEEGFGTTFGDAAVGWIPKKLGTLGLDGSVIFGSSATLSAATSAAGPGVSKENFVGLFFTGSVALEPFAKFSHS